MDISRKEFLRMMGIAGTAGLLGQACAGNKVASSKLNESIYDIPQKGNVSIIHITDTHAQLLPVYFREPNINLGVAGSLGKPPHLVGENYIKHYGLTSDWQKYAFTYSNFSDYSESFGKMGGYAHIKTLVDKLRSQRKGALLLDGGDTLQGSATSLWTKGQDMIDAQKILGVDCMTGHWEFTYGADRVMEFIENDLDPAGIDFLAQNVNDTGFGDPVFKRYTIREVNGVNVGVIGQAFPYTPIANPRYMIPEWSFGIKDAEMAELVTEVKDAGADIIVVLSHNGMDVDLKLASIVPDIDIILGGHTHDITPAPSRIKNPNGKDTLVVSGGSNGKVLGLFDLTVDKGGIKDFNFKMLPVFSNLLPANPEMQDHIDKVRKPYLEELTREINIAPELLYRRGNFAGSFDQVLCDALMEELDAPISFSPGFRWGTTVRKGDKITFDDIMSQGATTYPVVTRNLIKGKDIKIILEDVADNLFNKDPFYQQGGDMVRVGGLKYAIDPNKTINSRISELELDGKPLDPEKEYPVAGWSSVAQPLEGKPVWEVFESYLKNHNPLPPIKLNEPKLIGMDGNPGILKI